MKKLFSLMLLFATILTLTACSDKDKPSGSSLSINNYTLYAGDSEELQGTGLRNLKWIGDTFVANVDKDGVLHGNKVGYTYITSNDITSGTSALKAIVKPHSTYFSEPLLYNNAADSGRLKYKDGYLQFDPKQNARMPKADIWGVYSAFLNSIIKECGLPWTLQNSTATSRMYKTDKTASPYVAYILDNKSEIVGAGVYVKLNSISTLPDFLNERYLIYDIDTSAYKANFAHAIMGYTEDEIEIDYIGQMSYSSSLGMVILIYMPIETKSRSIEDYVITELKNLTID